MTVYLSRFGVKNYKCLADVEIPLTPIHVLIGPNDAGKTSAMEAMEAFYASGDRAVDAIFPPPWDGRDLVFQRREDPVQFHGEWSVLGDNQAGTHLRYGFSVLFPSRGDRCRPADEWIQGDGARQPLMTVPLGAQRTIVSQSREPGVKVGAGAPAIRAVSEVLNPVQKFTFDPRLMSLPVAIRLDRRFTLERDGFGLATLLRDILERDPSNFLQIRDEICRLFPHFGTVRLETENGLIREGASGHLQSGGVGAAIYFEDGTGAVFRAQQVSDGAILILGFLALAHLPDPPNLLLIEEPENGIYPKRLGEVITLLKQLVTRTEGVRFPQIIISTHSPYVLSFFEPEEVTFLSRHPDKPEAGVRARPLRDAPHVRERLAGGQFYLGELWYNLSEEELFGEP